MKKLIWLALSSLIATQAIANISSQIKITEADSALSTKQQNQNERVAQTILRTNLAHGEIISVRKVLTGLNQGDFVQSIEVLALAQQSGAYLEVILDNAVIACLGLTNVLSFSQIEIRKINGVDYNRILIRSIGSTYLDTVRARIGDSLNNDPLPPLPPPPPNQPPPPLVPEPPQPNQGSLKGYCEDTNHSQFVAAKNFAYSANGLDMSDELATQWALSYNQTHACYTINEYQSRFNALYNFAYSANGLDLNATDAKAYALEKVELVTAEQARRMQSDLIAIKNFAYSANGLDLTSADADKIGKQWLDRGYCEDSNGIKKIATRYASEYNFAYSVNGLNYDSQHAKEYALDKVRPLSRCSDLLR